MTKSIFKKITLIITLVALAFTFSACSFLSDGSNVDNGSSGGQTEYSAGSDYTSASLKSSLTASAGVTFNGNHTTKYTDPEEVISETKIDRAVVTLYVTYSGSAYIGSGVIVDVDDGVDYGSLEDNIFYVITCHHVINDVSGVSHNLTVYLPDTDGNNYDDENYDENYKFTGYIGGTVSTAKNQEVSLVGGDLDSDIAVLRLYIKDDAIASTVVKAKVMAADYSLKLAEKVIAIGNPLGDHAGWVSTGTVADVKYSATVENVGAMTLVGIDVASFPGNSGGGLFNMYGELCGITNSGDAVEVYDTSNTSQTISQRLNYAIPHKIKSDASADKGFVNIVKQLIGSYGEYNYGYISGRRVQLGITLSSSGGNVYISSIDTDGLAYYMGLRASDVINSVAINSGSATAINSVSDFSSVYSSASIGDTLRFNYTRSSRNRNSEASASVPIYQYFFCNTGNYTGISA